MGFATTPEEAQALIDKDPRNREALFPYLNGEDHNSRPDQSPSRWVINFKDWPLDRESAPEGYDGPVARDYPDLIRIVEDKVKPERSRLATGDATARDRARRWWQFARPSINFYEAIKPLSRALARSRHANAHALAHIATNIVASEATVVFALEGSAEFGLLQSAIHVVWLNSYASSIRSSVRYTPSDCLDTFPFPSSISHVEPAAREYGDLRAGLLDMFADGLTKLYARISSNPLNNAAISKSLRM